MKKERKKIKYWKIAVLVVFAIVLGMILWAKFFYYPKCNSLECFNRNLEKCRRAELVFGNKMIFEYKIIGINEGKCAVNVKLIQGELNNQDSLRLEKKEMRCYLPLGLVMLPESNIDYCHGLLKEELQDLIISKLYRNIAQNLANINSSE